MPVYQGNNLRIGQTYAARVNGLEVRLKSVRVLSTTTEVEACYDFPTPGAVMAIVQDATLQLEDGPEVGYTSYNYLTDITDDHCVRLGFPSGGVVGNKLVFRVHKIVVPLSAPEEKAEGPWEFYVDLPSSQVVPGVVEPTPTPTVAPTPIGEQTLDNVTMSLDWVYADVKRIAFGYTIAGLPDVPDALFLNGRLDHPRQPRAMRIHQRRVRRQQHCSAGGGEAGHYQRHLERRAAIRRCNPREVGLANQTLPGWGGAEPITYNRPGDSARPADATPFPDYLPPGYVMPSVPDRLVGTFHFEATTQVYPMQVLEPKQVVEANGISMRLERAEVTPSYARFILCYHQTPPSDWGVRWVDGRPTPILQAGEYVAQYQWHGCWQDADYGGYTRQSAPAIWPAADRPRRALLADRLPSGHHRPTAVR